jgi:hypothetical protein
VLSDSSQRQKKLKNSLRLSIENVHSIDEAVKVADVAVA